MSKQISRVVENSLKFLKLTKAGKLYLSAFPDKVIYRAKDMFMREQREKPEYPFSVFLAMCIYKEGARDIVERVDATYWDYVEKLHDNKLPDVTFDGEKIKEDVVQIELSTIRKQKRAQFNAKKPTGKNKNNYSSSFSKDNGPSFNRGIMYFKYGQWFKYPDVSWDRNSRPSLPVSSSQAKWLIDNGINPKDVLRKALQDNLLPEEQVNIFHLYESPMMKEFLKEQSGERPRTNPVPLGAKPKMAADDERRYDIEPIEELKKAIASGKLNKIGLRFLRDTYVTHKPELIPVIDEYINSKIS